MAWIHEARVNGLGFQKFAQLCLVLICKPQCSRECHVHLLAMDDSVRVCVCVCVCVHVSGIHEIGPFRCLPREWVVE